MAGDGESTHIENLNDFNVASDQTAMTAPTFDDGSNDVDTCRICRGEATPEEPLFYPCKCSGSIRYVHQECLMEWLGHSQKKHCELCKTPFRFTKLYASNMPPQLPFHIFIQHLVIHIAKQVGTWLRALAVIFVWVVALPWFMRNIWGMLFWFADGGWIFQVRPNGTPIESLPQPSLVTLSNGPAATSPASPLLAGVHTELVEPVNPGVFGGVQIGFVKFMAAALGNKKTLESIAQTQIDKVQITTPATDPSMVVVNGQGLSQSYFLNQSSLLGNVAFLKNLTPYPGVNRAIITAGEGLIISLVVVLTFVLVFLIREWVIQQQPGINMGAGFGADVAVVGQRLDEQEERDDADGDIQRLNNALRELHPLGEVDHHVLARGDNRAEIDRILRDIADAQDALGRRANANGERRLAQPRRRVHFENRHDVIPEAAVRLHPRAGQLHYPLAEPTPERTLRSEKVTSATGSRHGDLSLWLLVKRAGGDVQEAFRILAMESDMDVQEIATSKTGDCIREIVSYMWGRYDARDPAYKNLRTMDKSRRLLYENDPQRFDSGLEETDIQKKYRLFALFLNNKFKEALRTGDRIDLIVHLIKKLEMNELVDLMTKGKLDIDPFRLGELTGEENGLRNVVMCTIRDVSLPLRPPQFDHLSPSGEEMTQKIEAEEGREDERQREVEGLKKLLKKAEQEEVDQEAPSSRLKGKEKAEEGISPVSSIFKDASVAAAQFAMKQAPPTTSTSVWDTINAKHDGVTVPDFGAQLGSSSEPVVFGASSRKRAVSDTGAISSDNSHLASNYWGIEPVNNVEPDKDSPEAMIQLHNKDFVPHHDPHQFPSADADDNSILAQSGSEHRPDELASNADMDVDGTWTPPSNADVESPGKDVIGRSVAVLRMDSVVNGVSIAEPLLAEVVRNADDANLSTNVTAEEDGKAEKGDGEKVDIVKEAPPTDEHLEFSQEHQDAVYDESEVTTVDDEDADHIPLPTAEERAQNLAEARAAAERLAAVNGPLIERVNAQRAEEPQAQAAADAAAAPPPPATVLGHVGQWLWGDAVPVREEPAPDDERIVENIEDEEPFVHVHDGLWEDVDDDEDAAGQDGAPANGEGGEDDGIDDGEDMDGVLELVGMRGPLLGLIQNAAFGTVLLTLTIGLGVWIPYNVGKVGIVLVANPLTTIKLPLRFLFALAAIIQDWMAAFFIEGYHGFLSIVANFKEVLNTPSEWKNVNILRACLLYVGRVLLNGLSFVYIEGERFMATMVEGLVNLPDSEIPTFSALAHESLIQIKSVFGATIGRPIITALAHIVPPGATAEDVNLPTISLAQAKNFTAIATNATMGFIGKLPATLTRSDTWVINLNGPVRAEPVDATLAYWGGWDRTWAIMTGYLAFVLIGAAYVRKGSPFSTGRNGREIESVIIDILNQAGGVMKVILIISIEMLAFPLYCGLLLDIATLPLFPSATLASRMLFAVQSPFTSIFVHWFTGTCYMFHFALFVSMCRKILRPGVLYFIRDPDDPTFHPVRDVLERNLATQLRKIAFSGMVYGALVLGCMGGVIWGLAVAVKGALPIHWSSNEPVLEFPLDLLFYNFLMPVAIKSFRPSRALQGMYGWWFRKCARALRLSWFLLDARKFDEEAPIKSWRSIWTRLVREDTVKEPIPIVNGRFVRAPASDLVRIPKSASVFVEVDAENHRTDGRIDRADGLHGSDNTLFTMVYAPPAFRVRIACFILLIWAFAAVTGCSVTIIPLVFGRWVFTRVLPAEVKGNDVYAFSMGIMILGGAAYITYHIQRAVARARKSLRQPKVLARRTKRLLMAAAKITYVYCAFLILLPTLAAALAELYVLLPLHTYFYGPAYPHVVRLVEAWTLGLLYVNLARRALLAFENRASAAAERVTERGWARPDAALATKGFFLPAVVASAVLIGGPHLAARAALGFQRRALATGVLSEEAAMQEVLVHRYAYPFAAGLVVAVLMIGGLAKVVKGWQTRIRDEAYLIGERLHNLGERGVSEVGGVEGRSLAGRVEGPA
jgi:hypothetical protein